MPEATIDEDDHLLMPPSEVRFARHGAQMPSPPGYVMLLEEGQELQFCRLVAASANPGHELGPRQPSKRGHLDTRSADPGGHVGGSAACVSETPSSSASVGARIMRRLRADAQQGTVSARVLPPLRTTRPFHCRGPARHLDRARSARRRPVDPSGAVTHNPVRGLGRARLSSDPCPAFNQIQSVGRGTSSTSSSTRGTGPPRGIVSSRRRFGHRDRGGARCGGWRAVIEHDEHEHVAPLRLSPRRWRGVPRQLSTQPSEARECHPSRTAGNSTRFPSGLIPICWRISASTCTPASLACWSSSSRTPTTRTRLAPPSR